MVDKHDLQTKEKCYILIITIFFVLFLPTAQVHSQSEASLLFLLISPSTQANSMGETYGNVVSTAPMATFFNPASLGMFVQNNYIGVSYYPQKIVWLLASGWNYDASITNLGINLHHLINVPLSFGVSRQNIRLNIIKNTDVAGTFSSDYKMNGTTFSLALDYYVRASVGYTFKSIASNYEPVGFGMEFMAHKANINAHDVGFIVQVPIYNLLSEFYRIPNISIGNFLPYIDAGIYYSKTNIGGTITYTEAAPAEPIPRNLSLGINYNTGLIYKRKLNSFKLFSFKWAREIDDILIKNYSDGRSEYLSGFHDINIWDNLILGNSNDKINTKRGYEINLADFYFIRSGKYENIAGRIIMETAGWGINYLKPLQILLTEI